MTFHCWPDLLPELRQVIRLTLLPLERVRLSWTSKKMQEDDKKLVFTLPLMLRELIYGLADMDWADKVICQTTTQSIVKGYISEWMARENVECLQWLKLHGARSFGFDPVGIVLYHVFSIPTSFLPKTHTIMLSFRSKTSDWTVHCVHGGTNDPFERADSLNEAFALFKSSIARHQSPNDRE